MGNMASALGGGRSETERRFTLFKGVFPSAELSREAIDLFFFESGGSSGELRVHLEHANRSEITRSGSGPSTAEWVPVREVVTFTPTVRSTMHVGPGKVLAEYYAPYGWYECAIEAEHASLNVDGMFGVGEQKRITV